MIDVAVMKLNALSNTKVFYGKVYIAKNLTKDHYFVFLAFESVNR